MDGWIFSRLVLQEATFLFLTLNTFQFYLSKEVDSVLLLEYFFDSGICELIMYLST